MIATMPATVAPTDPNGLLDESGVEWIPVERAAQLIKSPRPGKRTSVNTIRRWIRDGRLEGRRRRYGTGRRWWYVCLAQVLALGALEPRAGSKQPVERN